MKICRFCYFQCLSKTLNRLSRQHVYFNYNKQLLGQRVKLNGLFLVWKYGVIRKNELTRSRHFCAFETTHFKRFSVQTFTPFILRHFFEIFRCLIRKYNTNFRTTFYLVRLNQMPNVPPNLNWKTRYFGSNYILQLQLGLLWDKDLQKIFSKRQTCHC